MRAFRSKAEALGYEVIDLDTWFFRRPPNERFEHPRDGHWNSTGHAVVSQAVLASKLLAGSTNQSLPASELKRPEAAAPAVERRN